MSEISKKLAHDLKNPLTIINGYISLLSDSDLSEEQVSYIKKIQEASINLSKIIDENTESFLEK